MLKTCKTFYRTAKSRHFWYNLQKDLQASSVCRPEDILENYTVTELENWTLSRLRARSLWKATSALSFRFCKVPPDTAFGTEFIFLPGGRWLLPIHMTRVSAIDLDAPQLEEKPLICIAGQYRSKYCYWVDDSRPQSSFRVALCQKVMDSTTQGRLVLNSREGIAETLLKIGG